MEAVEAAVMNSSKSNGPIEGQTQKKDPIGRVFIGQITRNVPLNGCNCCLSLATMLPSVAVNDSCRVVGHNGRTSDPQPEESKLLPPANNSSRVDMDPLEAKFDETKGQSVPFSSSLATQRRVNSDSHFAKLQTK